MLRELKWPMVTGDTSTVFPVGAEDPEGNHRWRKQGHGTERRFVTGKASVGRLGVADRIAFGNECR